MMMPNMTRIIQTSRMIIDSKSFRHKQPIYMIRMMIDISQTYAADIFFGQSWEDHRLKLPANMTGYLHHGLQKNAFSRITPICYRSYWSTIK